MHKFNTTVAIGPCVCQEMVTNVTMADSDQVFKQGAVPNHHYNRVHTALALKCFRTLWLSPLKYSPVSSCPAFR